MSDYRTDALHWTGIHHEISFAWEAGINIQELTGGRERGEGRKREGERGEEKGGEIKEGEEKGGRREIEERERV